MYQYYRMIVLALKVLESYLKKNGLINGPPTVAYYDLDRREIIYDEMIRKEAPAGEDGLDENKVREVLRQRLAADIIDNTIRFIREHEGLHKAQPTFNEEQVFEIQLNRYVSSRQTTSQTNYKLKLRSDMAQSGIDAAAVDIWRQTWLAESAFSELHRRMNQLGDEIPFGLTTDEYREVMGLLDLIVSGRMTEVTLAQETGFTAREWVMRIGMA